MEEAGGGTKPLCREVGRETTLPPQLEGNEPQWGITPLPPSPLPGQ
jgi:hypothetical protein